MLGFLGFCATCSREETSATCACPMVLAAAFKAESATVWPSAFGDPKVRGTPGYHELGPDATIYLANLQMAFG